MYTRNDIRCIPIQLISYPGFVLVRILVTRHEEGVRQVGLLHRRSRPLLHSAGEVVLVFDETVRAEEFYTLVVPVGGLAAHLITERRRRRIRSRE